jgi:hypothetical protein
MVASDIARRASFGLKPDLESPPAFLDFEASSLASASYPIEVAWSLPDPDGSIETHLISPASIERWSDWSPKAERIHGISQAWLRSEGKAPQWICERINTQLAGMTVYTDDPDYDRVWLTELFSASWGLKPSFSLAHADDVLLSRLDPEGLNRSAALQTLALIKTQARQRLSQRHRAQWDVEYLMELWRVVMEPHARQET